MDPTILILLSALPIAAVFILLVGLRLPALQAMGVGWLAASFFGLFIWKMEILWWAAALAYGSLQALEIVLTIFGAVLLMGYLEKSGALATIRWHFTAIHKDRRIQLLIIGYGVVTILEGVAGFGTPAALAAPLLVGLGYPPLAAAVFSLWFNAPNPPFGVAGIPTLYGVGSVVTDLLPAGLRESFLPAVVGWIGVLTSCAYVFWGLLAVFCLLYWFGGQAWKQALRQTKEVAPFALLLGVVAAISNSLIAWFIGAELPAITTGFLTLIIGILFAKKGLLMPPTIWDFPERQSWSDVWRGGLQLSHSKEEEGGKKMPVFLSWLPYLLVAGFLFLTRLPSLELTAALKRYTLGWGSLLGQGLSFQLAPFYSPGVLPFIPVAVLSGFLFRLPKKDVLAVWKETTRQILPAAITLVVAVSLAQVMIQSGMNNSGNPGMIEILSNAVARGAGRLLPLVSPWIGILGGFMTGSNTSSNILFSALQYMAAEETGVSRIITVALQSTGGGIGNLISILNVSAVAGVINILGREGDIIRKAIVPTVIYGLFAGFMGLWLTYVLGTGFF